MRALIAVGVLLWAGTTLLLSTWRRVATLSLVDRLRPHLPGRGAADPRPSAGATLLEVLGPVARSLGDTATSLFGVHEELETRLRRIGSPDDPTIFRLRQLSLSLGAGGLVTILGFATGMPSLPTLALAAGAILLTLLVVEQRLQTACQRYQRRIFDELPVVTEQIGMLIGAGFSLSTALDRIAGRGQGTVSADLEGVLNRVRQGLSEEQALREWADLAAVPELHHLTAVLTLNRHTTDLGRLIAHEARSMRRESGRRLTELIERRSQLVWVPVTVATLVPGVLLLAIPFVSALQSWSAL